MKKLQKKTLRSIGKVITAGIFLLVSITTNAKGNTMKKIDPKTIAPEWTVPLCPEPPKIDGKINPDEWKHAVSSTGLSDFLSGYMVLRQAQVWITHDDKNIYIAIRSPLPGHGKLKAKQKRNDVKWVFDDDAIELSIKPWKDAEGEADFNSVYHMIFNSIDTVFDMKRCKGIGQNFLQWATTAERANGVGNGYWDWEARIPVSDFGFKEIPVNSVWSIGISRNWKNPSSWAAFAPRYTCGGSEAHAKVKLAGKVPSVQLDKIGIPQEGKLDILGKIYIVGKDQDFSVKVHVIKLKGEKTIFEKEIKIKAGNDGKAVFAIKKDFPVEDLSRINITVSHQGMDNQLFKQTWFFKPISNDEREGFAQWNAPPKPKDKFECRRYHYVTDGILETEFDFSEYVKGNKVKKVKVIVLDKKGKEKDSSEAELDSDKMATVKVSVKDLPTGKNIVKTIAIGADGKKVSSQDFPLVIKSWPWLGNELGKSNTILPPFHPLEVGKNTISCLGREYQFGNDGLLNEIVDLKKKLLAAPQLLTGKINGADAVVKVEKPLSFISIEPHMVEGTASIKLGDLPIDVTMKMEYDGWLVYSLKLKKTPNTKIDSLDMAFSFSSDLVTLYHVVGDRHTDTIAGLIPEKEGIVWDSRNPKNIEFLGTFQTYVWVGNEKIGLSWMAENDRGWHTDDAKPCIDLVRNSGDKRITLRFHLINLPTPMDKDREIIFGVMATPSKPMPQDWRRRLCGLREFGGRKYWMDFTRDWCHGFGGSFYPMNNDYTKVEKKFTDRTYAKGVVPGFYTGFGYIAMNYPELNYFKAEWLGKEFTTYSHIDRFATRKYWGNDTRAYITSGAKLTDSYMDFMAWCYDRFFKKTGMRFVYYDLFNPRFYEDKSLGAYIRDDGQLQKSSDLFRKREIIKRIATIMYDNGLEPLQWVHSTGTATAPALSFAQILYDGEMRSPPEGQDHFDTWPLDLVRTESMGKQYGLVPYFHQQGGRPLIAIQALHDMLRIRPKSKKDRKEVEKYHRILSDFGVAVGNRDVEFCGYWENRDLIDTNDSDVFCSYYKRPGKVLLIVVNRSKNVKNPTLKVDWKKLGLKPSSCINPETKEKIKIGSNGILNVKLPERDYQIFVVKE